MPPLNKHRRVNRAGGVVLFLLCVLVAIAGCTTSSGAGKTTTLGAASRPQGIASAGGASGSRAPTSTAEARTGPVTAPPQSATKSTGPRTQPSASTETTVPTVSASTAPAVAYGAKSGWWRPRVGLTWQWQLSVPVNTSVKASVYDIDMFENSASVVRKLHAAHRRVICYVDVGSFESFRPDAQKFPAAVKGKSDGWPGERWLDIRQLRVLGPIMTARFAQCAQKGFDGVEPDLMDGFSNDTGFAITAADQLRYNLFISNLAHAFHLSVGLKNDPEQASELVKSFDFTINEQCMQYHECRLLKPFIAAGKPVFHVEYSVPISQFCGPARALHFSSMRKHLDLDAWRETC